MFYVIYDDVEKLVSACMVNLGKSLRHSGSF